MPQHDDILDVAQLAKELNLDQRTIKRVASQLGGRRFGNRWRFKWATVLEYFSNADSEKRQRQQVDGTHNNRWQANSLQDVSSRQEIWPRMESCEGVGGATHCYPESTEDPKKEQESNTFGQENAKNSCRTARTGGTSPPTSGEHSQTRGKSTKASKDPSGLRKAFFMGRRLP